MISISGIGLPHGEERQHLVQFNELRVRTSVQTFPYTTHRATQQFVFVLRPFLAHTW